MRLKGIIVSEVTPGDERNRLNFKFEKDKSNQTFEILCDFHPYRYRMRKWTVWTLYLKWESESYIESGTGAIRYHTYLRCHKATEERGDNP